MTTTTRISLRELVSALAYGRDDDGSTVPPLPALPLACALRLEVLRATWNERDLPSDGAEEYNPID